MDPQYGDSRPVANIPQPWNIINFYATPAKNDPWVPPGVIQTPVSSDPSSDHMQSPSQFLPQPGFLEYRSAGSPSDCATLPGDSGYGSSAQTYSIASASVHDGDDTGLDSHMGQVMSECHINAEAVSFESHNHASPANKHRCEDCNAWLRSQGELKKHRQRHLKSHKCPYDGCSKGKRGFSTSNDLVRHKRSVHGEHSLPGRSFICPHCTPGSKGSKIWPRADNFRSHLLRSHRVKLSSDDDHKEYIYRPKAQRNDLDGVGSSVGFVGSQTRQMCLQESAVMSGQRSGMDSQYQENQLAQSQEPLTVHTGLNPTLFQRSSAAAGQRGSNATSVAGEEAQYIHPVVLSGPLGDDSMGDSAEAHTMQHQSDCAVNNRTYSHEPFVNDEDADADAEAGRRCISTATPRDVGLAAEPITKASPESWKPNESGSSECTLPGLDDLLADMAGSQQCRRGPGDSAILDLMWGTTTLGLKPNNSAVVNYLMQFPRELLQSALKGDGQVTEAEIPSDDEVSSRSPIECPDPDCDKIFNRQCELKKHMKRHQKPYGCTFKSCSKRFGSKNDWKRHESSQHFLLETWHCDKVGCNKNCQRRESFRNHLQKDHQMSDPESIDEKLETCRVGRHCDPRFWCGFCVRVIQIDDINERGGNSWTKRCDHIDNHLFGKEGLEERSIREWKHQEDQQEERGPGGTETVGDAPGLLVPLVQASPGEVEGVERKRRSNMESDMRPRKKASKTRTYMWTCCMCSATMNLKTSSCCFECHHARCSPNCTIESVSAQEKDDESDGEASDGSRRGLMNTTSGLGCDEGHDELR